MALMFANEAAPQFADAQQAFRAIWTHYQAAHFIYPAKMQRLTPALGLIQHGWPLLLNADPELFQFHAAGHADEIVNSVCAYRDTHETYVFQHAASSGQPIDMIACIRACLTQINSDPAFACARMYFRPENRWPARASRAIADAMEPSQTFFELHDYLYARPSDIASSAGAAKDEPAVRDLQVSEYGAAATLARQAVGPIRARALGFDHPDLTLQMLNRRWLEGGLRRVRRLLAVEQGGALAGLALCHASSVPINFSYLCSRTELLIHPDADDRARLITALARASLVEAAHRGDPVSAILVDPADAAAATQGGYQATQKQYACFIWTRENAQGAPSAVAAMDGLYQRIAKRAQNVHPTAVSVDRERGESLSRQEH